MDEENSACTQRYLPSTPGTDLTAAGFVDVHEIGRGGFGVVFRCRQPTLDRDVAVKVLEAGAHKHTSDDDFLEQRIMGRLTGHPHIANILEAGSTASDQIFIVMPYFANGSLDDRLRKHGPLSVAEALRVGVKLCGAIATAHFQSVVHGDITPPNILISDYGEPVLSDFGIARIVGSTECGERVVAGSPSYIAPELFRDSAPTAASDVYGLGAVLYRALSAHAPFEKRADETIADQVRRIMSERIPNLAGECGLPDDVSAMVESAMSRKPEDRPTAATLGKQIQLMQVEHGITPDEMALFSDDSLSTTSGVPAEVLLGSLPTPSGNLPIPLTSFVDRREEIAYARKQLGAHRLVTLTGIGGVGKTRLALRIADKSQAVFPDGVWWIELADLRDGALVAEVFASALGLRAHPAQTPLEVLTGFLEPRNLLLVLDNCEQIVVQISRLVDTLLQRCPDLHILATSREALDIAGEAVQRVPPLLVPEAGHQTFPAEISAYESMTLFVERATTSVPEFEITDENCATVARICSALDGLPLAIELAAARMKSLSLDQIAERLVSRYTLLTRGWRDAPQRQQTLRSTVDWSYELCTANEQHVWTRMSVFAGSFELDAAEDVLSGDLTQDEVLDAVCSLVDKSILIREESCDTVRFRMLYTIRDYGREKLETCGETTRWCRLHQRWYIELARSLDETWLSERQRTSIERLSRELPNLREALSFNMSESARDDGTFLRFVNTLYRFWLAHGMTDEGCRWVERALSQVGANGHDIVDLACALNSRSAWACMQGNLHDSSSIVEHLRVLDAENPKSMLIHAYATRAGGLFALFANDPVRARSLLGQSLDTFESTGDLCSEVEVVLPLGWAHTLCADPASALLCFEKAIVATKTRGEVVYLSHALFGTGVALLNLDHPDEADEKLREGLWFARSRGDPFIASMCMESMAWVADRNGNTMQAAKMLAAAEGIVRIADSTTSTVLFPALIPYHEACVQNVLQVLGTGKFSEIREKAASLRLEAAVAYALEEASPADSSRRGLLPELTKREREIAALVADGLTNKAIASNLFISQRTVGGHVEHILAKLGLCSRAQVAAWVVRAQATVE